MPPAGSRSSLDADLVITSTSDVYGNATPPFSEDGDLVIGPPTTKRWAYAVSKMYDEHYALALADEKDLRVTILRLFNAYGPRNHLSWWGGPVGDVRRVPPGRRADGDPRRRPPDADVHVCHRHRGRHHQGAGAPGLARRGDQPRRHRDGDDPAAGRARPGEARHSRPARCAPGTSRTSRCRASTRTCIHRVPNTDKAERLLGFKATVGLEDGPRPHDRLAPRRARIGHRRPGLSPVSPGQTGVGPTGRSRVVPARAVPRIDSCGVRLSSTSSARDRTT